jgi:hypothetical protein
MRTTAGLTRKVDCTTGLTEREHPGSVERDHLGAPAAADGMVQVLGQVSGKNVITAFGAYSPSLDYTFDFSWRPSTSSLVASVSSGAFPAFEVYARQPGGAWLPVIRHEPTAIPLALMGDAFGINMLAQTATVTVTGAAGQWESEAPERRFSLDIRAGKVVWTERGATGTTLRREVALRELDDGAFRIERANDPEVLSFLGFQPSLRAEILSRSPQPSFLVLRLNGGVLRGEWNGIFVTKDAKAHLQSLVQPGVRPAKTLVFARVISP